MSDVVLVAKDGPIATVTLNRPEKLNALNKPMWQRLGTIMDELSRDESVRCVVLTGAGEKAFGPGADIAEFEAERANAAQARAYGKLMHETMASVGEIGRASCRERV